MSLLIYNQRQPKSKKVSLKQALTRIWEKDLKSGNTENKFWIWATKENTKKEWQKQIG